VRTEFILMKPSAMLSTSVLTVTDTRTSIAPNRCCSPRRRPAASIPRRFRATAHPSTVMTESIPSPECATPTTCAPTGSGGRNSSALRDSSSTRKKASAIGHKTYPDLAETACFSVLKMVEDTSAAYELATPLLRPQALQPQQLQPQEQELPPPEVQLPNQQPQKPQPPKVLLPQRRRSLFTV